LRGGGALVITDIPIGYKDQSANLVSVVAGGITNPDAEANSSAYTVEGSKLTVKGFWMRVVRGM
jgi:hypothetical protein